MGYEFKLKESEARMRLLYTLGALILLSTSVMAQQELNPVLPETPKPEVEQTPTPEVSPWRQINRVVTCNSLGVVRNILETNGQTIYATGYKTPEYLPMDPFDGIIITRNEITLEYTVLLIKSDLNIACVLAGGQRFEIIEDQM
jgi:hypothetical protein